MLAQRHNFSLMVMGFHHTMRRHLAETVRLHMLVRLSLLVRVLVRARVLRVLMVLVVVLVMVTQELVDTPSGHGALVCSHEHRSLGKALAVSNHSPFRKCNLCTVIRLPLLLAAHSELLRPMPPAPLVHLKKGRQQQC
jgi:hypothetical protein